jgi:hypothetical protein
MDRIVRIKVERSKKLVNSEQMSKRVDILLNAIYASEGQQSKMVS